MASHVLSQAERDQLELHINDITALVQALEGDPVPAAFIAEAGLTILETNAGGFPGTGRTIGVEEGATLSTPEMNQLSANITSLTVQIEGPNQDAAQTANEMLSLLENTQLGIFTDLRDVTETQLP